MPPDFSDDATARLQLPYLAAAQAQKHVTLNEALSALDGLVQTAAESATVTAEPADPPEGALYILPVGRTGPEWSLHPPGSLLRSDAGGWVRLASPDGVLAYVRDTGAFLLRAAGAWRPLGEALGQLQNLTRLGLGTEADAANPLAAKLNKALFTARAAGEGGDGDLRVTFNKETAADVLSLLFQTGFSGRAEIGLVGDNDLAVRVSPDGTTWKEALTVTSAAGRLGVGVDAPLGVLHTRSATDRAVIQSDAAGLKSSLLLLNGDAGPASGSGMLFGAGGDGVATGFIGGVGAHRTDADANSQAFMRVLSGGALTPALVLQGASAGPTLVVQAKVGVGLTEPKARLDVDGAVRVKSYAVAAMPGAASEGAGAILFVANEAGGPTLAFSDGATWRRVADRAVAT